MSDFKDKLRAAFADIPDDIPRPFVMTVPDWMDHETASWVVRDQAERGLLGAVTTAELNRRGLITISEEQMTTAGEQPEPEPLRPRSTTHPSTG